ncbi:CapA family protein [Candidatus Bathyarchaeota archaeon]|nr:CapA family protein [Candidatus Bathyarchaeota archaeon]
MSKSVLNDFTFAAGGDLIGPYVNFEDVNDPTFKQIYNLFKNADLGYANQEGAVFDLATFIGYPSAETGGGYPLFPLAIAREIRAMGINAVSLANNHAIDWGMHGLVSTLKSLKAVGITQAGGGVSETEARAPAYIQVSKGKVALVSATSSFPPSAVAGPPVDRRGIISQPRPGISALHLRHIRLIKPDQLSELRKIAGPVGSPIEDGIRISNQYFCTSNVEGTLIEANPIDKIAIFNSILEARKNADLVIFSMHSHEGDDPTTVSFFSKFFHEAIDSGADIVIRTGPHAIGGIEIYKDKPIFHSLGSLFLSFGGVRIYSTPSGQKVTFPDEWFETIITVCKYKSGKLNELRIYPAEIESSTEKTDGFPHLVVSDKANRILERVKELSAAFGTVISIEEHIGLVEIRNE